MKLTTISSIAGIAILAVTSTGFAQTCASPIEVPNGPASVSGNTCNATNVFGTLCGLIPSTENDMIYTFTTSPSYTASNIVLTNNTATWNAGMLIVSATCSGSTPCVADADLSPAGEDETINVTNLSGVQYLIVTSSPGSGGCGEFTLQANGTLPVKLQSFSVN